MEERQRGLDADVAPMLTDAVRLALRFIVVVVDFVPPRIVPLFGYRRKCRDVWSAASYEGELVTEEDWVPLENPCRMGYVHRAAYTALANEAEVFRDADLIWYIDNISAAMAIIKGASGKADLGGIAVAIHAVFARLNIRVWVEYVESASNPADGLSRAGLEDTRTLAQGSSIKGVSCPKFFQMEATTVDSIEAIVSSAIPRCMMRKDAYCLLA